MPSAYFLLNVALNQETNVIEEIKKSLSAYGNLSFEVQGVFGVFDIVVKVSSNKENDIRKTAIEKIRSIEHIQSAITMMVNDD